MNTDIPDESRAQYRESVKDRFLPVSLHEMTSLFTLNSFLVSGASIAAAVSPSAIKPYLLLLVSGPALSLLLLTWNAFSLRSEYLTIVSAAQDAMTQQEKEQYKRQIDKGVFIQRRKHAVLRLNLAYILSLFGVAAIVWIVATK